VKDNYKVCGRKGPWSILWYYTRMSGVTEKNMKKLGWNSQNFNPKPLKYTAGLIANHSNMTFNPLLFGCVQFCLIVYTVQAAH
jgi:hypothetical protein